MSKPISKSAPGVPYADRLDNSRRCTAHRQRDGKPCGAWAIRGGFVCRVHSGAAPQVLRAAKRQLDAAADLMARQLLNMALDPDVSDATKLAAITNALDRSIGKAPTTVEIGPAKPFEVVFDDLADYTRAESRQRRGVADEPTHLQLDAVNSQSAYGSADLGSPYIDVEPEVIAPEPRPDPPPRRYDMPHVQHVTGMAALEASAAVRRQLEAAYPKRRRPVNIYTGTVEP